VTPALPPTRPPTPALAQSPAQPPAATPAPAPSDANSATPDSTTPARTPPSHKTLKARAVKGSVIWAIAYTIQQIIRLGSNVWLGHLLLPWAFGMVAIARAIQQGLSMFSEIGIRPAMIQSKRDDDAFVNTAWTLGAIRGIGIWGAAAMLAYPMAIFYGKDALVQMVPVLALTAVLSGLESTRVVSLNRELREGPRAVMEVAASILTRGTMILWAYASPTPWALVAGTIVGGVFTLFISHLALPGRRNRFCLERDAIRAILKFGSWIFIGTVIAFLGQQLDKFMLGKLDGLGMLGVYAMALTLASLPREVLNIISTKILYPVLAEVRREDPERYATRVTQIRAVIVPAGIACILGVTFASPWYFTMLFPPEFHDAAWISPLACFSVWFAILNSSANKALLAMGNTRPLALAGAIKVAMTGLGCAVGYAQWGTAGFVLGVGLGAASEHAMNLVTLHRAGIRLIIPDLIATATLAALALAGWFAPDAARALLPGVPTPALVLGLLLQAVIVAGASWLAFKKVRPLLKIKKKSAASPATPATSDDPTEPATTRATGANPS